MTDLMLEAIDALRGLPDDQQDDVARAVLRLAGRRETVYVLTAEEEADLDAADREVARGDIATDEHMKAIWTKYGL